MQAGLDAVRVGVNAREIAAAVYRTMIGHGGDYPGMAPFIRFRDALLQEHVTWPDREVVRGDSVFFELSASVARYHAPLTRMAYVGEPPDGTEVAGRIAADALHAVTAALVPGARACDVYAAWQDVVNSGLGHDRYRRHHCGYQVGIGFPPSWVGGPAVVGLRSDSRWRSAGRDDVPRPFLAARPGTRRLRPLRHRAGHTRGWPAPHQRLPGSHRRPVLTKIH